MKSIKYASKTTSLPETFHAKKKKKNNCNLTPFILRPKKQGLAHILTNDSIHSNGISVTEILRRTRVFYFNKYGGSLFYLF